MKKTLLFSVMGAAILAMSTASAGGYNLFNGSSLGGNSGASSMMNGIYVGGSYGQATARCVLVSNYNNEDCTNNGWKALAGYKFTDNLAVEGAYYNLGKTEERIQHASYGQIDASSEATGFGLSGVYSHEIFNNLDVFGKLGVMNWNLEGRASNAYATATEEQSGTSLLYGAGASYKFTNNLAVRGEYERYTAEYQNDPNNTSATEDSDVDVLSAGITFSTH